MFNTAVIIAGGIGSRMIPLTEYIPKPLVKVNGTPLINHVISFLKDNNIHDISVTYGYKSELLLKEISKKVNNFINTDGQDNSYFLFNSFVKHLNYAIVVCPCDMIVEINMKEVYDEYIKMGSPPIAIVPISTNSDADSIEFEGNLIKSISRENKTNLQACGIQIINPYIVNKECAPLNNFYDVWKHFIDKKMLYVFDSKPSYWKIYDKIQDLY